MTLALSRMFGMDIFTTEAKYVGKAQDFIIDLEEGRLYKIVLEPLRLVSKQDIVQILKRKSVDYAKVVAVNDIILIDEKKPAQQKQPKVRQLTTLLRYRH